ncbi:MAG: 50S ribosomal protein L10 [Bacteroidota bacterium]|nr:50S ribosomal protein L10 [Bacteroidota bacterium]
MKKEEKSQFIDTLTEDLKKFNNFYIADIGDLTVEKTSTLRRLCFKKNVKLKVVKNTLLKKALDRIGGDEVYSALYPILKGNTSLMFSESLNDPAKVIKEFRKKNKKPILKGAFVQECCYVGDNQLDSLVSIKGKKELIGDIIGLLQSPAKNVISALQSGGNKLSGIVKTLSEKSE